MNQRLLSASVVLGCVLALAARARGADAGDSLDILITGAQIVDGTGRPAYRGDVGVRAGWIVRVTAEGGLAGVSARERIDASGLVLAPGFIDVHSHTVEPITGDRRRRLNEGVVRQGVTTVVGGPDGEMGPREMRQAIEALARDGAGTNVALYIGHTAIRKEVLGSARRAPSADELARMKALVKEGMELGAAGLSSALMYEPGMFSTTDEVVELAKVVAPYRGIYDSHVRDPMKRLLWSDEECLRIGELAGVAPKIAHEKAMGLENAGKIHDVIRLVNAARARGIEATTDQYPYDGAAVAPLASIVVVPAELRSAPAGFDLKAALRDPATRRLLKQSSEQGIDGGYVKLKAFGYSSMRITTSADQPMLVGKYLSQLAEERRVDPFDLVAELLLSANRPISITLGGIQEEDVRALLLQPWNMIATDGGYVDSTGDAKAGDRSPHPRWTGTFPRVLGHYVREAQLLTLEEAVRKMTSLPADVIGLHDRGRLFEGQAADLVLFDARTIADRSTWEKPTEMPVGVRDVIVGGVVVLRAGRLSGAAPGRYLRSRR